MDSGSSFSERFVKVIQTETNVLWVFLIDLLTLFSISEGVYWLKPEIHDSNNNSYICESLWKIVYLLLSGKTRICQADSNRNWSFREGVICSGCVFTVCVCVHCCVCVLPVSMNSEYGSPYFAVCNVTSLSSHWLDPKTSLFNLANYFPIRSIQWINWVMS